MLDVGLMLEALLSDSVFSTISTQISTLFGTDFDTFLGQLVMVGALHDIGKCHPLFQQKQPGIPVVQEQACDAAEAKWQELVTNNEVSDEDEEAWCELECRYIREFIELTERQKRYLEDDIRMLTTLEIQV